MKKTFLSTVILFLFICNASYGQTPADLRQATEYFNKGNEKLSSRDYTAAISFYDKAIAIDYYYALAYYDRGIVKLNILRDTIGGCIDLKKASEFEFTRANAIIVKACH